MTRHPLVDGKKRLAWQCLTVFLDLNGIWFDPPEYEAYRTALATVDGTATPDALATFIRDWTREWEGVERSI